MAENIQCTTDNPCTAVVLLVQRQNETDEDIKQINKTLESLRNRLLLWATLGFTVAGTSIGILASHIK